MRNAAKLAPKAEIRTVKIAVDDNGSFVYEPALLHANPGDSVSWSCKQGDFTISFPERSPFDKVTIHGSQDGGTGPQKVRSPIEPAVYHYHVAVAVHPKDATKGRTRVLVDSGCPGIEVPA